MKNFSDLSQQEILALAIQLEEEDYRTYADLAEVMRANYPGTARLFAAMADEEDGHRHRLLDLYRDKFGDHIPLIRRQDVKGFLERKSFWLSRPLGLDKVRAQAELMEAESKRFYQTAARHSTDAAIRQLLDDLAAEEPATRRAPRSSKTDTCRLRSRGRNTSPSGASSCCRSSSPASPG